MPALDPMVPVRTKRLRVAVLLEHYGRTMSPCASIRLHGYLEFLRRSRDIEYRSLLLEELDSFGADVIIWHRISLPTVGEIDALHAIAGLNGARLVYDIDDNLLEMDEHGEGDAYRAMRSAVVRSLQVADEVWCSTAALAERMTPHASGRVEVLANALDPRIWKLPPRLPTRLEPDIPFRLLYMGTRTHDGDFQFLCRVMKQLEDGTPGRYRLTLVGVCQNPPVNAPWLEVLSPPASVGASYPAFVHWLQQQREFHLGVAPLMSGCFNECKSSIKVLDYAAFGIATLASAVPAYSDISCAGRNCALAENDVTSWCGAIMELRDSPARLASMLADASALVDPTVFADSALLRLERLRVDVVEAEPGAVLP